MEAGVAPCPAGGVIVRRGCFNIVWQRRRRMIAIVAKMTVKEGKEDEFKAAGAEMVAAVKANEAGRALQYTLAQSKSTPTEFYFIEAYADDDAAAAHIKTDHMAAFGAKLAGMLAGRPEIIRLDPVATIE
jgi:quinol monooxygenase YgiN